MSRPLRPFTLLGLVVLVAATAVCAESPTPEERASLLRVAATKHAAGDFPTAELAWRQVLQHSRDRGEQQVALLGLARTYRQQRELVKAAATYERFLKEFPSVVVAPEALLELGRTLRALGSHQLALARFYSVLHATLKIPAESSELYRQLARTAQFEIAETHYLAGDYAAAVRFFGRLDHLELAPEDRAHAQFRAALASLHTGDEAGAVAGLQAYLRTFPQGREAPEARYQLVVLLHRQKRAAEALGLAVELLRQETTDPATDERRRLYWQRRAGNHLANAFFEQGDYVNALALYRQLAGFSPDPRWRLPALYQAALCEERLLQTPAAIATHRQIVEACATAGIAELDDLAQMAGWRLEALLWRARTETDLDALTRATPPS